MRLIDADALIEQMEADAEHMDDFIGQMMLYASVNDVKNAPTVTERKKGEWIVQDHVVCCSECGEPNMEWYFCPYCGADMRGE